MSSAADRVGSALFFLICAGYTVVAFGLPSESPNMSDVGPRLYPLSLGILMLILAGTWLGKSFVPTQATVADSNENEPIPQGVALLRVSSLVLAAALFPIFMRPVGFVVTASIFLAASVLIITWRRPDVKQLLVTVAFSIASAFILKWLFSDVLSIFLP